MLALWMVFEKIDLTVRFSFIQEDGQSILEGYVNENMIKIISHEMKFDHEQPIEVVCVGTGK